MGRETATRRSPVAGKPIPPYRRFLRRFIFPVRNLYLQANILTFESGTSISYRMKIINLEKTDSVLGQFVAELRDVHIQQDSMRFRRNMERIGEIMAYEISKKFTYSTKEIGSPLGTAAVRTPDDRVVVGTILRAGLPFHQGFLSCLDHAGNAFVSAYRKYKDRLNFDIHIEYIASPWLEGKTLVLTDPMLATGSSMELAYEALRTKGEPAEVHLASIIASREALDYLQQKMPDQKTTLWIAALDDRLDEHSYIVPGLGDAGDLAYGEKE